MLCGIHMGAISQQVPTINNFKVTATSPKTQWVYYHILPIAG